MLSPLMDDNGIHPPHRSPSLNFRQKGLFCRGGSSATGKSRWKMLMLRSLGKLRLIACLLEIQRIH